MYTFAGSPKVASSGTLMLQTIADDKMNIAARLAETIAVGLSRRDTDHAAFCGCIDWHSAVHGSWALTAYTRMTGDLRHEAFLAQVLDPHKIAREHRLILDQPAFEMPYGRAWFLRLAREHALLAGSGPLTAMADDVQRTLLSRFEQQPPNPGTGSYQSDSWALINMLQFARWRGDGESERQIEGSVLKHFSVPGAVADYAPESGHFMSTATNWAWLVGQVLPQAAFDPWAETFFAPGMPGPVTAPTTWHHHGLNFSRCWGLWGVAQATAAPTLRAACLAAYAAHFRNNFDDTSRWRDSYRGVAHWVPQFGMLALQPMFSASPTA
jgi:hypothetical protein